MSKDKQFDTRFKEKIGEISTNPLYGSWDTFQKKWKNADVQGPGLPDSAFDIKIKSRLTHVKPVLPSGHWQQLKYRLETIEIFREKIIIHKIKEVVAVGLFIFTFFNVTHFPDTGTQHTENPVYATLHKPAVTQNTRAPFTREKNEKKRAGLPNIHGKTAAYPENIATGDGETTGVEQRKIDGLHNLLKSTGQFVVTSDNKISLAPSTVTKHPEKTTVLPVKKIEPYSEMAAILPMRFTPAKLKNSATRIGIFASKMHNFILTPFDKVYSVPEFSKSTNNFGYGFTIGKKRGHLEIESGASYARLKYKPVEIRETFASAADVYFETSLASIQFDLVKIPLNLKYYAVDNNNWKFYTMAGTSLNILANAEYGIEENLVKGRPVSPYRFSAEGPRLEDKPFTYGFFDKGHFRENYYVDVSLGMGLEVRATRNLYLYCQPAYHAFIFSDEIGVGPNQDKLNAFQVQTGFKWTLQ